MIRSNSLRLLRTLRHPTRTRPFLLTGAIAALGLAAATLWFLRANALVRIDASAAVWLELLAAAIVVFATLCLLIAMLFGTPGLTRRGRSAP